MASLGQTKRQLLKWEVDIVIKKHVTYGNIAEVTVFIYIKSLYAQSK